MPFTIFDDRFIREIEVITQLAERSLALSVGGVQAREGQTPRGLGRERELPLLPRLRQLARQYDERGGAGSLVVATIAGIPTGAGAVVQAVVLRVFDHLSRFADRSAVLQDGRVVFLLADADRPQSWCNRFDSSLAALELELPTGAPLTIEWDFGTFDGAARVNALRQELSIPLEDECFAS